MAIAAKKRKDSLERLNGGKYFNLIEHAADGIAVIQGGAFKMVNTALCRISGYGKKEMLGMPFTELLTPQSQKLTLARYQARLAGKKVPPVYEIQAVTKDKKIRDIEINAALTEYDGRAADEVIVRDITERKQAEETLKIQKAYFQQLFDNSPEAIVLVSRNNRIVNANKGFEALFGYTLEEIKGQSISKALIPEDRAREATTLRKYISNNKAHRIETVIKRKDGKLVDVSVLGYPIRFGDNIVGAYIIYTDITERKQAEQALRRAEREKTAILNSMSELVIFQDLEHRIIWTNTTAAESVGMAHEQLVGRRCYEVWPQRGTPCVGCPVAKARQTGKPHKAEIATPDGRVWSIRGYPTRGENGAVTGLLEVTLDITERKQAEEALQAEKNKLQSVIDAMADGLSIQDKDFNIIYQNEPSRIGADRNCLGEKCYQAYENRDKVCDGCPVAKAFEDGKSHTAERRRVSPSGKVTFWENTASPVRNAQGNIVSCLEITRDITERKQAEQVLDDEATRRRILIDQSRDGIVVLDHNGKVYEANQQFAEMLGYTPEEAAELHVWDWEFVVPREQVLEMIRTVDEAGDHFETKHRRKDGSVYDVEISTNGAVVAGQKLVFCVCRDITERKQAEGALKESEERYRAVIEGAHDMIQSVTLDGSIDFVNQAWLDALGYTRADLPNLKLSEVIHPDSLPHCRELFAKATKGEPVYNVQATFLTKDGRKILVEGNAAPRYIGDKVVATQGIFRDITERKHMEGQLQEKNEQLDAQNEELRTINEELQTTEEELQHSQERLERMFESVTDGIVVATLDGTILKVNQRAVQIHGFASEDKMLGRSAFDLVAPRDHERIGADIHKALKEGVIRGGEYTLLRVDGTEFPGELSTSVLKDGRGNVIGHISISRDITGRKQAEAALRESEEKFSKVFHSSANAIGITSLKDGKIIEVNESHARFTGYTRQEVIGHNTAELDLWVDKEERQQWQNKLKENGRAYNEEIRSRTKSGEIRIGLASAETINIGDEPCRITVIADITERKQMEKLFQTVTNSSQVGIYIVKDRKFQMANPQFQKLTGFTEDELKAMDSLALVLDEDRDKVRKEAIKMLNGERSSPYQFRVLNKSGETRWVMETVTSIPYRGGRAILGNYMDITERRQAEEREKQLEQELNLASRLASIGQLAAGVAHEINNPLTGVIGFSHLMLKRDIPDDMKQDLQVIHSEAQRVAKIVENLLVFAHQRKPGREYLNINEIINRVLELRAYEMKVNNIDVENRLSPDLPSTMADAGQLQQVFLNIVLNAEHFMSKAHNKGKLVVKTEKIGGNIRVSFTDNGAGISKENMDKIFNPFFTTKDVGDGTGLGLSICHGIITQHNGRIYAESELGKGATFVIEIPLLAEPAQPGKAEEIKKEPRKPRGAKILVVDDEVAILVFLKRLLTEWGHSVETINNANKALERLKTERYSLILLDIKLPGMSGIELYHHIEKTVPALTRRVIFITGDVMQDATRSFLEKTGVPHITKPIDIEVLKKMISRALNQTKAAPVASG